VRPVRKSRQTIFLDHEVKQALDALAAGPGGNKSHLVNDALKAWLARRGAREIDDLLKTRLDRISRDLAGARRDIDVLLESLALFVRYQLTVTPPLPEADAAGRAVGRDRFEAFVAQVGRQIAGSTRTFAAKATEGAAR
jgi:predicted transcriptional regulator